MKLEYLLDTNTVSFALKGRGANVVARLRTVPRSKVAISIITEMELRFGLAKSSAPERIKPIVETFLDTFQVMPLPADIAKTYAVLRADLEKHGRPIGALDTIIASHAIALRATLVTNNGREFGRVRGLRWEDWTNAS